MSGFDDLANQLDELADQIEDLGGEVPFGELFPPAFMRRYTDTQTIDEFFESSPWDPETEEEFESIPESELDTYVNNHSRFRTWEQMMNEAGQRWINSQLED